MKVPKKNAVDTSKFPQLPEMQPFLVEIETPGKDDKPNPQYLDEKFNNEPRKMVQVRMRVVEGPFAGDGTEDNPAGKIWGKHGFTLGKKKSGEASMLRQLVMAARPDLVAGKDEESADKAIHDFDLDFLRGERLTVIGRYDPADTERIYLKPIAYGAAPPGSKRAPGAAQAAADDGYQISPDGRFRFREGMTEWEPIPVAAAPPPPPPPPAAAPPAPPAAEDGYQYSPDKALRWKEGMPAWEPVPPVAPPPVPVAAAPALPAGPPPLPGGAPPPPPAAPAAPTPNRADF